MTTSRFCGDGGILVRARTRLPDDRCEYYLGDTRVVVGCNRLRCQRCDEWVRSEAGLTLSTETPTRPDVLFASKNWSELPSLRRSNEVRLYSCRCTLWAAANDNPIDNDHDSPVDPNVPWKCEGHSVPELPTTLGELKIGVRTNWNLLAGKIMNGTRPRDLALGPGSLPDGPSLWLGWLYGYLRGLPIAENFSSAIGECVVDREPTTVGRALCFFTRFPRAAGYERILERAEATPKRVAVGYRIPEFFEPLTTWDVLMARLEQRDTKPDRLYQRTIAVVRKVLLLPRSSLSHEDLGTTDLVAIKREQLQQLGHDMNAFGKQLLEGYARSLAEKRADVVANTFASPRVTTAFCDPELRQWIADNIVKLDAAAKGRWRIFMNELSDWYRKPELGHLIVIAGARLIEGRVVGVDEFREWMKQRRNSGWVDDAWVLPLEAMLDEPRRPLN